MGKNLKLNIKNTQLAEAFKLKKSPQPESQSSLEKEKKTAQGDGSTTQLVQPKESVAAVSAVKEAEKHALLRDKEQVPPDALKKRKTRLVEVAPIIEEPQKEESVRVESVETEASEPSPVLAEEIPLKSEPQTITATPTKTEVSPPSSETAPSIKPPVKQELPELKQIGELAPRKVGLPKDLRTKKPKETRSFDARDRQGLRAGDDEAWRKKRSFKQQRRLQEEVVIRPKELSVRLPITIKDLAHEMKLKASQLIAKLFMQGVAATLNDYLDDETVVQLLGHEFDCANRHF